MRARNIAIVIFLSALAVVILSASALLVPYDKHNPWSSSQEWIRRYPSVLERSIGAIELDSGDVLVAGTRDTGYDEFRVSRIDSGGNMLWNRTIVRLRHGYLSAFIELAENRYLLLGDGEYYPGNYNHSLVLLCIDENANLIWNQTVDWFQWSHSVRASSCSVGGAIIIGTQWTENATSSQLSLLRINELGTVLWNSTLTSSYLTYGKDILECSDGSFFALGTREPQALDGYESSQVFSILFNSNGVQQWNQTYAEYRAGYLWQITYNHYGGFLAVGEIDHQSYLYSIAENGTLLTQTRLPHFTGRVSDILTCESGYLLIGSGQPPIQGTISGIYCIRVNNQFDNIWTWYFRESGSRIFGLNSQQNGFYIFDNDYYGFWYRIPDPPTNLTAIIYQGQLCYLGIAIIGLILSMVLTLIPSRQFGRRWSYDVDAPRKILPYCILIYFCFIIYGAFVIRVIGPIFPGRSSGPSYIFSEIDLMILLIHPVGLSLVLTGFLTFSLLQVGLIKFDLQNSLEFSERGQLGIISFTGIVFLFLLISSGILFYLGFFLIVPFLMGIGIAAFLPKFSLMRVWEYWHNQKLTYRYGLLQIQGPPGA
jgi:hypothetical protein